MLHPFLFIGVGGSGGKTLRTLRADLGQRLLEASYAGPWPTCWQFLHVDVPTSADGNEPDLPGQLDEKDYVGLVPRQIDYRAIDDALVGGRTDGDALRNLIGWRPDPSKVNVPVERGAGQYRALGRAITLANLDAVGKSLRKAIAALNGPQMMADLGAVSRALGAKVVNNPPEPEAVVVSSLAGGSGSGAFLDICDALRAVGGGGWTDESYAVLYAPDVFQCLDPDQRKGIDANALAALCELMSGFWDPEPQSSDFAIMETRGISVGAPQRRGPRFPLIVGTKNAQVGFGHQNDVYRAIGKALSAWVSSEHLQNELKSYTAGNWANSALLADSTRLRSYGQEQPLCAIGFARVSLGRDNFATYASERLARTAAERILRQHLADRPPEADPNHDVAIEEKVTGALAAFLANSGLDEQGVDRNQILDALSPTDRPERLAAVTETVRAQLVRGKEKPVPRRQWLAEAIDLLREHQRRFADEEVVYRNERARDWVNSIQERLVSVVSRSVAAYGAPVTERLLNRLRGELNAVLTEFPEEEAKYRHHSQRLDELVSGVLQPTNDAITADNPAIVEAIAKGLDCFDYLAEADLRHFAVALVKDLLHGLVEPLHTAVRTGRELLAVREVGVGKEQSLVERWPTADLVPRRFYPAANEFLLEPVEDYPGLFRTVLQRSSSANDPGGAELEFVRHTVIGSRPTDRDSQRLIRTHSRWVPAVTGVQADFGVSSRAQFELLVAPEELVGRARGLIDDRESPVGMVVSESLQDYLDPVRVEPAELKRRLDRFNDAFVQVLQTSAPLVNIDPRVLSRVHDTAEANVSYMFTEIPFPDGTPGYNCVKAVLESRRQWNDDAEQAFTEGRQSRIDVFSVLASAYNPVVFESIIGPIADQWSRQSKTADGRAGFWHWRRARPLSTFLPCSPEARLALVRGWFTARLLGELVFNPNDRESMSIWAPDKKKLVAFPMQLLGAPVFDDWERLPAVLESMPIALVEYAERASAGSDALAPYWRLRDLGVDARGAHKDYAVANQAIQDWIRNGQTAPGGPTPLVDAAGPLGEDLAAANERKDRCLYSVENWRKRYGDLVSVPVTPRTFFATNRVVEIQHDLMTALDDLERAISHIGFDTTELDY